MQVNWSFSQRIVVAFILMNMLVGGVFSLSLILVADTVENYFISRELESRLNAILKKNLGFECPVRANESYFYYAENMLDHAIPEKFSKADDGFSEIKDGSRSYYVYAQVVDGKRYLLAREQGEHDIRKGILIGAVVVCFFLAMLASWGIGRIVAKKVMVPVSLLAKQVTSLGHESLPASPLAPKYAADEIGQLAAAFDDAFGRLHRALEREQLFNSDVSHELRTPLMIIATSCELLAETPATSVQRGQIERIRRAAERMLELVRTFLQLSRSEENNRDTFSPVASLAEIAEEQSNIWTPRLRKKGLVFELIREGADSGVYDAILLRTVMSNLLRNAAHYTDSGGVQLILEEGGFRVKDTGIGIAADQQQRIFEPFVRGSQARGEGMGLGLSLVLRICVHQGWNVTVCHLSSSGSCFRVAFHEAACSKSDSCITVNKLNLP